MEATDRPRGAIKGIGRAGKEEIVWRRLPGLVLLGAFAAAVGNALVYLAGSGLGTISPSVLLPSPMGSSALGLSLVVATSALALLAAGIVLLGIGAVSRRPMTVFRIVATVVAPSVAGDARHHPRSAAGDAAYAGSDARCGVGGQPRSAEHSGCPASGAVGGHAGRAGGADHGRGAGCMSRLEIVSDCKSADPHPRQQTPPRQPRDSASCLGSPALSGAALCDPHCGA